MCKSGAKKFCGVTMGWQGPGKRYFYHKRREAGRVVAEYAGTGRAAELAEKEDAADRLKHRAEMELQKRHLAEIMDQEIIINQTLRMVTNLTTAFFMINGYHLHKGHWRRKR